MIDLDDLLKVLDRLEEREASLLGWGDSAGYFTLPELDAVIAEVLPQEDLEEVEDELRQRVMIVPVLDARNIEVGVRSRMAEAVHLYRNLRQWFHGQDLEEARTLVSDYRFIRRRRLFPTRNLEVGDLVREWRGKSFQDADVERALGEIVGGRKLAGFQARATELILKSWEVHMSRGSPPSATIVCAGTGSGKTLAFYLPVLSCLAANVVRDKDSRVRVLAIYPRKELLKDQFSETWEQCRKLDQQLKRSGSRKIRIGAFFGETPDSSRYALAVGRDHLHYTFLRCPSEDCLGEMRWSRCDVENDLERLRCHVCGHEVCDDEIGLTRQSMAQRPPDVLFTTIEMLNQRMTDSRFRHLFGVGVAQALPVVLLDEVHTYHGSQGAQTAMMIGRWMRLSGKRPHFVGLSATLRDAASFFGTLTGTNRSRVSLIEPDSREMEEKGAEYLLALRGDPVSQTALLSTTIQAGMLTRRILDSQGARKSGGVWGCKTFMFTDELDVNNRLFAGLADAEGWRLRGGNLSPKPTGPLAQLRNPALSSSTRQLRVLGQDWAVAKSLGFALDSHDRARVSRTSSQDTGYARESDIVVTTAQLELGFNDPDVGAVIQHKAPRGVASYLQRKGRAGRSVVMRPWMIVVLSDFGRDRVAYQQYENLVDPEVQPRALPLGNIHILKMQAALAVLDWLSTRVENSRIWNWMNQNPPCSIAERQQLLKHVDAVMSAGSEQDELSRYIREALAVNDAVLDQILWQAPRAVLLEVLPTLKRRLASNWAAWSDESHWVEELAEKPLYWGSPVPEFIPNTSFSELSSPDLSITLDRQASPRRESMPFFQGLKEFAPGRVSKRFSIEAGELSDWLVPDSFDPLGDESSVDFEISSAFGSTLEPLAGVSVEKDGEPLSIYQPRALLPKRRFADRVTLDTSNAFLRWRSIFTSRSEADWHDIPKASNWSGYLKRIGFFVHSLMAPLEVVRYCDASDAEVKLKSGSTRRLRFQFSHEGKRAGIGTRMYVDAVGLDFEIPRDVVRQWLRREEVQKAVRVALFQDRLRKSAVFGGDTFAAHWVAECFLAAVSIEAELSKVDISTAARLACNGEGAVSLRDIPDYLFQLDRDIEDGGEDAEARKEQRLQLDLKARLADPEVLGTLSAEAACLHADVSTSDVFMEWAWVVIGNTLAAAFQQAICTLIPHADEQSVNAEYETGPAETGRLRVWLTEADSGGMGIIAELREVLLSDPLKFLNSASHALEPGSYEQMDADLHAALREAASAEGLAEAFAAVRIASSYQERLTANRVLRSSLTNRGFLVNHTFASILFSRVLKPGSGAATDREIKKHLDHWNGIEIQSGLELPLNVACTVLALTDQAGASPAAVFARACGIMSMLWVRGAAVRQASLGHYNRFQDTGNSRTERLLGAMVCKDKTPAVQYSDTNWLSDVHGLLDKTGSADLVIERARSSVIAVVVATLHVTPLDTHGLLLYPRIRSVRRGTDQIHLRIELPEAIN